jgi:hypothetical protein
VTSANARPDLVGPPPVGRSPSQLTVLTVLTQTPAFGGLTADSGSIGDALEARAQFEGPNVGGRLAWAQKPAVRPANCCIQRAIPVRLATL